VRCLRVAAEPPSVAQQPQQGRDAAAERAPAARRSNSYKNKENIDLSKLVNYQRTDSDTGSTEVQIARLSARIEQLTLHLGQHKKDFSCRRGLEIVLSQRKKLMAYLQRTDRRVAAWPWPADEWHGGLLSAGCGRMPAIRQQAVAGGRQQAAGALGPQPPSHAAPLR
jgi:small subunit ribosomal protein S15